MVRLNTPSLPTAVLVQILYGASDVIVYTEHIQRIITVSKLVVPAFRTFLDRALKRLIANANSRLLAERDIAVLYKTALAKKTRKSLGGTVAKKGS